MGKKYHFQIPLTLEKFRLRCMENQINTGIPTNLASFNVELVGSLQVHLLLKDRSHLSQLQNYRHFFRSGSVAPMIVFKGVQ